MKYVLLCLARDTGEIESAFAALELGWAGFRACIRGIIMALGHEFVGTNRRIEGGDDDFGTSKTRLRR